MAAKVYNAASNLSSMNWRGDGTSANNVQQHTPMCSNFMIWVTTYSSLWSLYGWNLSGFLAPVFCVQSLNPSLPQSLH